MIRNKYRYWTIAWTICFVFICMIPGTLVQAATTNKTFDNALLEIKTTTQKFKDDLTTVPTRPLSDEARNKIILYSEKLGTQIEGNYVTEEFTKINIPSNSRAGKLLFYQDKFIQAAEQLQQEKNTTKQQILTYNAEFSRIYNLVIDAVEKNDVAETLKQLNILQSDIEDKKKLVNSFQESLKTFQNTPNGQYYPQYLVNQVFIPQINEYKGKLVDEPNDMATSINNELLQGNIEFTEDIIAVLNTLSQPTSELLTNSVNNLQNQWMTVDSTLKNVIKNIQETKEIDVVFISSEMGTAKDNWEQAINVVKSDW